MSLVVLPAQLCDLAYPNKIYDVFFDAFTSPMHMVIPILFPQMDVKSEAFRKKHDTHALEFASSPAARFQYPIKCIDAETGDVVGTAIFEVYWRPRTPAEWDPAKDRAEWLPAGSEERKRADDLMDCHILAVHPSCRRRGIASLLMKWGTDLGEHLGVPLYLESSDMAVPLYEQLGFQQLKNDKLILKKETLWSEEDKQVPLMVWMPSLAKGLSFDDWKAMGFPESYQGM